MAKKTRIKAKLKKGIVTVKALANHAMLSYQEAEKAKKEVNFITSMVAKVNGKIVYEVSTSQFLSKNPYASCYICGNAGAETIVELWIQPKSIRRYKTDERLTFKGKLRLNDSDVGHFNYILIFQLILILQ